VVRELLDVHPSSELGAASSSPAPAAATVPLFAPDDILDNTYRIVGTIAMGGMGEIYRAMHLRLPRALAIKTLQTEFSSRSDCVTRFCREACALARLNHPNIVQVLDFNVTADGVPYIAMELIEGEDLRAALNRGRRFDVPEVLAIVRQIASALETAHAAGVVHRDLKPENIVLTPTSGRVPVVSVIDFGLSLCFWAQRMTAERMVFGTPEYMAPEQALGQRDLIDTWTDQFALSALTYTLLAGRPPYARETAVDVLHAIVNEPPAPLGNLEGWNASTVEQVLRKGMARVHTERYPSVAAFSNALEQALVRGGALPTPTRQPTPVARPARRPPNRHTPSRRLVTPRKRASGLRRCASAAAISLLLAGFVWGGAVNARPSGGRGWRNSVESMRASMFSEWNRLLRTYGQETVPVVAEPQPE